MFQKNRREHVHARQASHLCLQSKRAQSGHDRQDRHLRRAELATTFQFLSGKTALLPVRGDLTNFFATQQEYDVDLAEAAGTVR